MTKDTFQQRLKARHAREARFRCYGIVAIALAVAVLVILLISIALPASKGFMQSRALLTIPPSMTNHAHPDALLRHAMITRFPDADERGERRSLMLLLGAQSHLWVPEAWLAASTDTAPRLLEVPLSSPADLWIKAGMPDNQYEHYGLNAKQARWLHSWKQHGDIRLAFNWSFFTTADSREPEKAGFGGSMIGSLLILFTCLLVSLPVGVGAAIYLEECARPSRWKDIIEVNINNLAAIPSIIYGLLGLFVFLGIFGMPRSSAVVGGLTLSLLTLPVIIIATRIALAAVPNSLRDAARGIGASPLQVVTHHVLPQALPGIMTGTILGMARAIGETAPLLMIGMVAFIANVPSSFTDPATAMPVQIYLWSSNPEQGYVHKTASGILVLILVLLALNLIANIIRAKAEKRGK